MIRCAGVFTYEVDDKEVALKELNAQIEKQVPLLKNTIGIVMCHPEFVFSGVMKYICQNLPFETVGATSAAQAVNGESGEMIFTVFVITSDDNEFKCGVTGAVVCDLKGAVEEAFKESCGSMTESAKLIITFAPVVDGYSGDDYANAWQNLSPGTPIFGGGSADDTINFANCETICNGESHKDKIVFVNVNVISEMKQKDGK